MIVKRWHTFIRCQPICWKARTPKNISIMDLELSRRPRNRASKPIEKWGFPPKPRDCLQHRRKNPNEQTQCLFLSRLPLEIRTRIFLQVFEYMGLRRHIHVARSLAPGKRRLECVPFVLEAESERFTFNSGWTDWGGYHNRCLDQLDGSFYRWISRYSILSILLSCLRM